MVSASTWVAFGIVSLGVAVCPGPATAYIFSCSLRNGSRCALRAVAGLTTGSLLVGLACTWGIWAVPAVIPDVLDAVRAIAPWVILFIALRTVTMARQASAAVPAGRRGGYLGGILVNLFNPGQYAVFLFLAPGFQNREPQGMFTDHLGLALLFTAIATVIYLMITVSMGRVFTAGGEQSGGRGFRRFGSAAVLVGVALYLLAMPAVRG